MWEITPGSFRIPHQKKWELCVILHGVSEITEDGSDTPITVRAGDSLVLRPGFTGTWKTIETTRKIRVQSSLAASGCQTARSATSFEALRAVSRTGPADIRPAPRPFTGCQAFHQTYSAKP